MPLEAPKHKALADTETDPAAHVTGQKNRWLAAAQSAQPAAAHAPLAHQQLPSDVNTTQSKSGTPHIRSAQPHNPPAPDVLHRPAAREPTCFIVALVYASRITCTTTPILVVHRTCTQPESAAAGFVPAPVARCSQVTRPPPPETQQARNLRSQGLQAGTFAQAADRAPRLRRLRGCEHPCTPGSGLLAPRAVPDADGLPLHLILAAEGALVLGVLRHLHLLHDFPERRAIARAVLAGDPHLLGALVHHGVRRGGA
eukprot:CAMPEP_0206037464 /NCGR_PEP_ID=MMETSP1466-20131121/3463_1 /ASSEMBLY_ACC=CAM_ASM_001126 /TAXON_ID=44452 /ORGANISM="Pavlova gyrans, Strain CCMP608" /LENGTH=255 /DNA_ID=CAMNT_0053412017 /DNA_START=198 /DNA_END=961 /DNA_ORIENTATION=+